MESFSVVSAIVGFSLVAGSSAFAQSDPPAPASLSNVSGCSVEGSDVFVSTGQGAATRRFKYVWDASVDALCNANGFAISAPKVTSPAPISKPAAPTLAAPAPTAAAPTVASDFPADLPKPSAEAVKQRLSGKTFAVKLANGTSWKLDYKSNGYYFVNTSTGFNGSGTWQTAEGQLCGQPRGEPLTCNEVRDRADGLVLKRQSGEVIVLVPQ